MGSSVALDFSSITSAITYSAVVSSIMAMAIVKLAPNFTKWAVNKLSSMFGG
jgi:hypothetical protein